MPMPRVSDVLKDLADAADAYAVAVQAHHGELMLATEASGERVQEGHLLIDSSPAPVASGSCRLCGPRTRIGLGRRVATHPVSIRPCLRCHPPRNPRHHEGDHLGQPART